MSGDIPGLLGRGDASPVPHASHRDDRGTISMNVPPRPFGALGSARLLALLGLMAWAGCGGVTEVQGPAVASGEARQITDLVENFNEARLDPKRAGLLFVEGSSLRKEEL